jgi:hypothetical protein
MSNHYYYLSTATANFATAKTNSSGTNKHLVTINNANENAFVKGLISSDIWIGGEDIPANGTWSWVTGEPWAAYTNWDIAQPDNIGTETAVEMLSASGKWNNLSSATTLKYIMELVPSQWTDTTINRNTGQSVTLSLTTYGDITNLSFQWMKDGEIIQGATSSSFSIPKFDEEDEGVYTCIVKNKCGYVISRKFNLIWTGC